MYRGNISVLKNASAGKEKDEHPFREVAELLPAIVFSTNLDGEYSRSHAMGNRLGPHGMLAVADMGFAVDKKTLTGLFEFFERKERGAGSALKSHGISQSEIDMIEKPCTLESSARKVREMLDKNRE